MGKLKFVAAVSLAAAFSALPLCSAAAMIEVDAEPSAKSHSVNGFSMSMPYLCVSEEFSEDEPVMIPKFGDITGSVNIYGEGRSSGFPDKFDLREENTVSEVKDQGIYGTCWAHSAIASAESTVSRYIREADLSEFHTAFYAYYGEDQINRDMEPSKIFDLGGTRLIAANLWSQWIGPVKEKRLEYGDISFFDNDSAVDLMKYRSDFHLRNAYFFDYDGERSNLSEINDIIKRFVYNGTAVDVSFQSDNNKFYSYKNYSTRSDRKPRFASHSVAIVGWDDNFPKENFRKPAEIDGAWLVKNSWGKNNFDDGYMWISYDDRSLCEFAAFELEDSEDHTVNFHHDTYVAAQSMSAQDSAEDNAPSYMANIFTADSDVQLEAVMTSIIQPFTDYEITIYTGLTDKNVPSSGKPSAVTKGTAELTGTLTIDLDENVTVKAGETFSVVMKAYSEESPYVIPVESSLYLWSDDRADISSLGTYTTYDGIKSNTSLGESFYSEDGSNWFDTFAEDYDFTETEKQEMLDQLKEDLYDGIYPEETELLKNAENTYNYYESEFKVKNLSAAVGNIALKVLGSPVNTVNFSHITGIVPENEAVELSVKDGSQIYYSVNGSEYAPYTEPLKINGAMVISATVDNVSFTERSYISSDFIPESGDADGNGSIDAADASAVLEHYSDLSTGGNGTLKRAIIDCSDVNCDGFTDAVDASLILKIYAERSTGA